MKTLKNLAHPWLTYVTRIAAIWGAFCLGRPRRGLDWEGRKSGYISADGTRIPHLASMTPNVGGPF